jgi:hypothetical protein
MNENYKLQTKEVPYGHIFDAFGVKGKKREELKFSLDYDTLNMMKKEG